MLSNEILEKIKKEAELHAKKDFHNSRDAVKELYDNSPAMLDIRQKTIVELFSVGATAWATRAEALKEALEKISQSTTLGIGIMKSIATEALKNYTNETV